LLSIADHRDVVAEAIVVRPVRPDGDAGRVGLEFFQHLPLDAVAPHLLGLDWILPLQHLDRLLVNRRQLYGDFRLCAGAGLRHGGNAQQQEHQAGGRAR
jgi:hypothetical protein